MKNFLKQILRYFNIEVIKSTNLKIIKKQNNFNYNESLSYKRDILFFESLDKKNIDNLYNTYQKSKSQLGQDLFVLNQFNFKENGYFVEFGATNGLDLSNTFLLEKEFGWKGIVAEPCKSWHTDLKKNRNCKIDTNCVWVNSNSELNFNETESAEYSTITDFNSNDYNIKKRKNVNQYKVSTISLNDLLIKYDAPQNIDYLSIDTEGSEYEILRYFDFKKYSINVITVEHNFTSQREQIFNLLSKQGYERVLKSISKWDDWYILNKQKKNQ